VPHLGGLRLGERHARPHEIGAGILHAVVEEQLEQPARQVVMMRHVLACNADRIVLMPPAQQRVEPGDHLLPARRLQSAGIGHADIDEVVERPLFDRQLAVHVGFADLQPWIEGQCQVRGTIGHSDCYLRLAAAERLGPAAWFYQCDAALIDAARQQVIEHAPISCLIRPGFHPGSPSLE
jgi:hypothetical protein